jgi:hypothetical protein
VRLQGTQQLWQALPLLHYNHDSLERARLSSATAPHGHHAKNLVQRSVPIVVIVSSASLEAGALPRSHALALILPAAAAIVLPAPCDSGRAGAHCFVRPEVSPMGCVCRRAVQHCSWILSASLTHDSPRADAAVEARDSPPSSSSRSRRLLDWPS